MSEQPIFASWDLECSNLKANMGTLLTAGFQRFTQKNGKVTLIDKIPYVIKISDTKPFKKDVTDDSEITRLVREFLMSVDIIVGFYSGPAGFDIRFAQGKMGEHGLEFLPTFGRTHIDLYFACKKMALTSGGLAAVSKHLKLPGEKTYLDWKVWRQAAAGYKDAIEYIAEHNAADVALTTKLYERVAPLVYQHPLVGTREACWCGAPKQRRGKAFSAAVTQKYKFQCTGSPSHWSTQADK